MVRGLPLPSAPALALALCAGASVLAGPMARAEGAGQLGLTLAGADPAEGTTGPACRLSFLAENGLGSDLSAMVLEAVLFTREGSVERLLLLDFRDLPAGKPRLRQFDLPGADCATLGQVLINGAQRCEGATPGACIDRLRTGSRIAGMEVSG